MSVLPPKADIAERDLNGMTNETAYGKHRLHQASGRSRVEAYIVVAAPQKSDFGLVASVARYARPPTARAANNEMTHTPHADQVRVSYLATLPRAAYKDLAGSIDLKNRLRDIETNCRDCLHV
jgi:hypothetical protein